MFNKKKRISTSFQKWLLLIVGVAFTITLAFLWTYQNKIYTNSAKTLLKVYIKDVCQDISDTNDKNLLVITHASASELEYLVENTEEDLSAEIINGWLNSMLGKYNVTEINYVDATGIITASTNQEFIGFNISTFTNQNTQSAEFAALLGALDEYVQDFRPITFDNETYRKYAGVSLKFGGFIQVGYDEAGYLEALDTAVKQVVKNRHVGESGYLIVTDENWDIVSDREENQGQPITILTAMTKNIEKVGNNKIFEEGIYIKGSFQRCFCILDEMEGYKILAVYPYSEAMASRNISVIATTIMLVVIFGALVAGIYILVHKIVVKNMKKVNESLSAITSGNLETVINVRSHIEFDSLSNDINSTVDTLKRYIKEAEERIDAELAFAKAIQHSALPSVFPPYPNREEFDIFATMHTAKEVGGDFYDFYFVDDNNLAFLMADVSGKGIPAAMFMMTAKTIIKSYAESGMSVEEVFTHANAKLCEGNDAGMFVTAWMGIIDVTNGKMKFVNAGHNPPLLKRADGAFEYLKTRAGFVLAGMEGLKYRVNEITLNKGDRIFLYTDGVTEATDLSNELYGEDRLVNFMNENSIREGDSLLSELKTNIDTFVGEAPQFDDITMLIFDYKGKKGEE